MDNVIDDICEHIDSRPYTVPELVKLLGLSRSAIYRYIEKGCLPAYHNKMANRPITVVDGSDALAICSRYADLLYMYSTYGSKKRSTRISPGLTNRQRGCCRVENVRRQNKADKLRELGFEVARICRQLQSQGKKVTVRAVRAQVGGRTQVVCKLVRQWKREDKRMKKGRQDALTPLLEGFLHV